MTYEDIHNYMVPALSGLGRHLLKSEAEELEKLLGFNEYHEYPDGNDRPISEDYKRILIALSGPHARTILKAYMIRKGIENKERSNA